MRQDSCVCRSNAVSVGRMPTGQHEKLPKRWRNRPSGVCLQGLAPNRPERHWLKTVVVSVGGKGVSMGYVRCGLRRRAQANHR